MIIYVFHFWKKKKLLQEPLANKNRFQRPVFAPKTEVTGLGWNQKPIYLDMDFRFISDMPISVFAAESDMNNFKQPNEHGISRRHTAWCAKQWPNATRQKLNSTACLEMSGSKVRFGQETYVSLPAGAKYLWLSRYVIYGRSFTRFFFKANVDVNLWLSKKQHRASGLGWYFRALLHCCGNRSVESVMKNELALSSALLFISCIFSFFRELSLESVCAKGIHEEAPANPLNGERGFSALVPAKAE